ncbi:DNA polymerase IV, partial [bacterium]|nr:DNA polymerase IV [bacterium]
TDTGKARSKGDTYPRAITVVLPGKEAEFLAPLPTKAMWGVGPKTEESLAKLGIHTLGELAACSEEFMLKRFGKHGPELVWSARGIDNSAVVVEYEAKSISQETTFDKDSSDLVFLRQTLRQLSTQVGYRLRQSGTLAGVVRIKLRWSDFSTHTRQVSIDPPTDQDGVIYSLANELMMSMWEGSRQVRLLGVGTSNFKEQARQMELWETPNDKERRLLNALDKLRERYGRDAVQRGNSVKKKDSQKSVKE